MIYSGMDNLRSPPSTQTQPGSTRPHWFPGVHLITVSSDSLAGDRQLSDQSDNGPRCFQGNRH